MAYDLSLCIDNADRDVAVALHGERDLVLVLADALDLRLLREREDVLALRARGAVGLPPLLAGGRTRHKENEADRCRFRDHRLSHSFLSFIEALRGAVSSAW